MAKREGEEFFYTRVQFPRTGFLNRDGCICHPGENIEDGVSWAELTATVYAVDYAEARVIVSRLKGIASVFEAAAEDIEKFLKEHYKEN